MSFLIAYVTFPDKEVSEKIIKEVVESKLAACGNAFPISSTYWWNDNVEKEGEYVGIIKTIPIKWEQLVSKLEDIHPYDVPCIMKIEVEANEAYEKWIRESVN